MISTHAEQPSTTTAITKVTGMIHSPSIDGVADFDNRTIEAAKNVAPPSPFEQEGYANAASSSQGARILFSSDEWFASADRILEDSSPHFDPDAYCEQGKVMDGWESRRRREAGHDWSIVRLAMRAEIARVEIDTAHFTGNNVPAISLEIADLTCSEETKMVYSLPHSVERLLFGGRQGTGVTPTEMKQAEEAVQNTGKWIELLPKTQLRPGYEGTRMHYFSLSNGKNEDCRCRNHGSTRNRTPNLTHTTESRGRNACPYQLFSGRRSCSAPTLGEEA